jgi:glycine cleavage system transcriptional repressor
MEHYLVLTAVGTDRPDIVNQLTHLISDCDCNIVDSRMALFGAEFTLIMLISGNWNALTRIETTLPFKSHELELMTVVKRTTPHKNQSYPARVKMTMRIRDSAGIIGQFTQFISDQNLELVSLRSDIIDNRADAIPLLEAEFIARMPHSVDPYQIEQAFSELCKQLGTDSHEFIVASL